MQLCRNGSTCAAPHKLFLLLIGKNKAFTARFTYSKGFLHPKNGTLWSLFFLDSNWSSKQSVKLHCKHLCSFPSAFISSSHLRRWLLGYSLHTAHGKRWIHCSTLLEENSWSKSPPPSPRLCPHSHYPARWVLQFPSAQERSSQGQKMTLHDFGYFAANISRCFIWKIIQSHFTFPVCNTAMIYLHLSRKPASNSS